jgi:hypothetical protein
MLGWARRSSLLMFSEASPLADESIAQQFDRVKWRFAAASSGRDIETSHQKVQN